jgi:flagellar hook-associated protein FlgK|tara:strand:- start:7553 stop:7663 length:111 start_codon:yes stop_codon:yes gene_type:complete
MEKALKNEISKQIKKINDMISKIEKETKKRIKKDKK